MKRLHTITRLAICMAFLAVGALVLADGLGLVPNTADAVREQRKALCESIAIHSSLLATQGDFDQLEAALRATAKRNQEIDSIGLRRANGRLQVAINRHRELWEARPDGTSTDTQVYVPILSGDIPWGNVEIRFSDGATGRSSASALFFLTTAVGGICFILFFLFLRRVLQDLDPTRVVPDRVRTALDSLAEGLLLMDNKQRIVLANEAFAECAGADRESLLGRRAHELPWISGTDNDAPPVYPWQRSLEMHDAFRGEVLGLQPDGAEHRLFQVNSLPILDDDGRQRGVLASFDDVTQLETKKNELTMLVDALKASQTEVQKQNQELHRLAARDSMTGCLNRRAFFQEFEKEWAIAAKTNRPLSCIMVDIDHFKSVNDTHGHAKGDEVLVKVGELLRSMARETDYAARYGGEEFCILLPGTDIDGAYADAERLRLALADLEFDVLSITASLGVSSTTLGVSECQEMLEEADKCLYVAKRGGRNQVVRWDQVPEDAEVEDVQASARNEHMPSQSGFEDNSVSLNVVRALLTALAYRDAATAAHCNRVAGFCSKVAREVMSAEDADLLEIAALLHDIGKIGVPDSILLKPGALTNEEWELMRVHDRIGAEIVESAFNSPELTDIIWRRHEFFGKNPRGPAEPDGQAIPIGARLLAIADAFDSMIVAQNFRTPLTREQAFAELRRCAGTQFDPTLVEPFIAAVSCSVDPPMKEGPPPNNGPPTREAFPAVPNQATQIAQVVQKLDLKGLKPLIERLEKTAAMRDLPEVHALAQELGALATNDPDLVQLIEKTHELLEMCQQTQESGEEVLA